jgi:hypothetical protein
MEVDKWMLIKFKALYKMESTHFKPKTFKIFDESNLL